MTTTVILYEPVYDYSGNSNAYHYNEANKHTFTSESDAPILTLDGGEGDGHGVKLDGEYISRTAAWCSYGLSAEPDGRVSGLHDLKNDNFYGHDYHLIAGETYTFYIIPDWGTFAGGGNKGLVQGATTTVILKDRGTETEIGRYTTDIVNPFLQLYNDWDEGGGESCAFTLGGAKAFGTAFGGCFLTVDKNGNFNKETDVPWSGGKALVTGETYTFYVVFPESYCVICGSNLSACPTCGRLTCPDCNVAWAPFCSDECLQETTWTCQDGHSNTYFDDTSLDACYVCGAPRLIEPFNSSEPSEPDEPDEPSEPSEPDEPSLPTGGSASDVVVMPKKHWQDTLNSVRAKTFTTDLIKSKDVSGLLDKLITADDKVVKALACGTITPSTTAYYLNIYHGLGVKPNFFIFRPVRNYGRADGYDLTLGGVAAILSPDETSLIRGFITCCGSPGTSGGYKDPDSQVIQKDGSSWLGSEYSFESDCVTDEFFRAYTDSLNGGMISQGREYYWVCGVLEEIV